MKLMPKLLLTLALFTAAPMLAAAHAYLDHADPKVGSTVQGSPAQMKIWFTQPLIPGRSSIEVLDAKSQEVDKKDSVVDSKDPTVMTVSLSPLPPGIYKVVWQAVNVDTHHTKGSFTFTMTGP